jgi:hypothetical protein
LDDVERLLARQRFRTIPVAWREPILAGAGRGVAHADGSISMRGETRRGVETGPWWCALFRSGWTWVGMAWGVAWMLHVGVAPSRPGGRPSVPLSVAAQAELAAQMAALSDVAPGAGGWVAAVPEPRHPVRPAAAPPGTPTPPGRPRAALRRTSIERLV